MSFRHSFAAFAAAVSFSCFAVEAPTKLDDVVVTPTRTGVSTDDSLTPVIVITRADIEQAQVTDVAELLRFHAGLDVARNGGPGQATSVFIRGAESNHTLVLVDGVRINPGTIGGAAFQNLRPEMIERIEVVKGPRSSQWGSDAIGGVINIITRRPGKGFGGNVEARGGRYDTGEAALALGYRNEHSELGLTAQGYYTDGFPTRRTSNQPAAYSNTSASLNLAHRFDALRVAARHWRSEGNTEYLGFALNPLDQDYRNETSALEFSGAPSDNWNSRLNLSYTLDEIEQNQPNFLSQLDYAHTRRGRADWQNDWTLSPANTLTAGVEGVQEDTVALSFGTFFDLRIETLAGFVQHRLDSGPHGLVVAGRYTDHESYGGHTTGNLEYGYEAWDGGQLIAAAGTAFRAPDATDRFGFGGNPTLDPETSQNFEAGVRQQIGAYHRLQISAFRNEIRDLITCVGGFPCRNINIDKARIQGLETSWQYRYEGIELGVEGLLQDPVDKSNGERLARRAAKSLTASAAYTLGGTRLGLDLLASGRREDSAFNTTVLGGYTVVNLTASFPLAPRLRVQARIENLLDKQYELAGTFNTARTAASGGLRYDF